MVLVRTLLLMLLFSGCQISYLIHVSYNHLAMLNSEVPVNEALKSDQLTEEQKRKIKLTQEVRVYAFEKLKMKKTGNYTEYVDLKRPYVTYTVTASQKWKFEPYLWDFPFIGKAPYKGFYNSEMAKEEAADLKKKDLDVSVRGVSAYSTLGKAAWLGIYDPLLSSMLRYPDHILVNTIFHELTHTTLFIKDNINFNERLAVFVANKSTEQFYLEKEGANSKTLKRIKDENDDDKLFSAFITNEIRDLKKWYQDFDHTKNLPPDDLEKIRQERLHLIAVHFEKKLKPELKTDGYNRFFAKEFNNADLSVYDTYMKNLDVFEAVYNKYGANIPDFLTKCAELKNSDNPEKTLELWAKEP